MGADRVYLNGTVWASEKPCRISGFSISGYVPQRNLPYREKEGWQ